jgi:hypothetical protein
MLPEARMVEAVAARHIVGMPLSKHVQRGAIGAAKAGHADRHQ